MKIIALKYYDGGFMTQAFAFGGRAPLIQNFPISPNTP